MLKKIAISPESTNYGDNDANVAYLYRGYYVWQAGESGLFDAWNFALAVLHEADASLGETFEAYWDDDGCTESGPTRRYCLAIIDRYCEQGSAEAPQADPDAVENVTLTVSLNQAGTILAALSDRHDVVQGRFKEEAGLGLLTAAARTEALVSEIKATYQSVDRQVFQATKQ